MKTFFLTLISWLVLACGSKESPIPTETAEAPPKAPTPPALRTVRLFVAPLSDTGNVGARSKNSMDYFSLGLSLFATSRFEELSDDPAFIKTMADAGLKFEVVTGPHVLTEESAKLLLERPDDIPAPAVHAAAKRAGATHVLDGFFIGRVEDWMLGVVLFEVGPDRLKEIGRFADRKKIFAWKRDVPKPERPGVQIGTVHAMFGALTAKAFGAAQLPLSKEAVSALSTPQTPDTVSFIALARAYRAFFLHPALSDGKRDDEGKHMKAALEEARKAVNVWPDYQSARRLYAWLLWQTGSPEKARLHFQEVIRRDEEAKPQRPKDFRSLVALGRIDIATDQPDAARQELAEAAKQRPSDPTVQYWLGMAYAKLGRVDEAIKGYEFSRSLDPANLDTRRALASLYAGAKRYADAATELEVVVKEEVKNLDALMMLAACHRAAGALDKALVTYDLGLTRMPGDVRIAKLKKETEEGLGAKLAAFIFKTDALRAKMETDRQDFQAAVNDGTWLLHHLKKEEACADGFAGSDYLFAKTAGEDRYKPAGREFQRRASDIREALKDGAGYLLTPDELAKAEDVLLYEKKALRDYREMLTAFNGTFKPMLERAGCETHPDKIRFAKIEEIRARNAHRVVSMPEPPKRDSSGISPVVPNGAVDNVTFYVRNDTPDEITLVLDGKALEPSIAPHRKPLKGEREEKLPQYSTPVGRHTLCHVRKNAKPECVGQNVRTLMIEESMVYHLQVQ